MVTPFAGCVTHLYGARAERRLGLANPTSAQLAEDRYEAPQIARCAPALGQASSKPACIAESIDSLPDGMVNPLPNRRGQAHVRARPEGPAIRTQDLTGSLSHFRQTATAAIAVQLCPRTSVSSWPKALGGSSTSSSAAREGVLRSSRPAAPPKCTPRPFALDRYAPANSARGLGCLGS
jgi:hypothetical protein